MKITANIECTPEEARRLMGLPDLTGVHDLYLDKIKSTIANGVTPDMIEGMIKNWGPMGEASMGIWRQILDQMGGKS